MNKWILSFFLFFLIFFLFFSPFSLALMGKLLIKSDPLSKADIIIVLAGEQGERVQRHRGEKFVRRRVEASPHGEVEGGHHDRNGCGDCRHSDGERGISAPEVGHHVREVATRAGRDEDHAELD